VDPTIHPARSHRLLLFSCQETTPPSLLTPSIPRAPGKATELPCARHGSAWKTLLNWKR
jgi:hypothetical protein